MTHTAEALGTWQEPEDKVREMSVEDEGRRQGAEEVGRGVGRRAAYDSLLGTMATPKLVTCTCENHHGVNRSPPSAHPWRTPGYPHLPLGRACPHCGFHYQLLADNT